MADARPLTSSCVRLLWLPLGAGTTRIVQCSGRAFECVVAARAHRNRQDLYHSALEVAVDGDRYAIEMTPAWGRAKNAEAVVAGGPVGVRALGRFEIFRYEIHCIRNGAMPDLEFAVDSPRLLSDDRPRAEHLLELAAAFPSATWGRDELDTGEMWNSNSLTSWLLARSGHAMGHISPPRAGRAPGWSAGLVVADRQSRRAHSES